MPQPVVYWTPPWIVTPPPLWAIHSNAWPCFQWRNSAWCPRWTASGAAGAMSSPPVTCCLGEKADPHLGTTYSKGVVESDKVPLSLLFSRQNTSSFLSYFSSDLYCTPSLSAVGLCWTHSSTSISFLRGPELNTALKAWPHHPWVRGSDLFPSPANHPYNHHFLICTGSFLLVVCRLSLLLGVAYNELPTITLDTAASSTVACFVNISSIHRSPWPDLNRRYTSDQWGRFSLNTQLQM